MLLPWVVDQVKQRLAAGESQRRVALTCGVSRGTVAGIANGTRPDYEALRQLRQAQRQDRNGQGSATRCPKCGAKAKQPCKACQTRADLLQVGLDVRAARHRGEHIQQLDMGLKPAEQERYEQVRAEKIAADHERLTPEGAQQDWAEAEFERAKGGGRRAEPLVQRIRFVCPCGQLMRTVLIWRPGKSELIRFEARARHLPGVWMDTVHCPCCQRDFSRITPEQFRAEVMATSLPTGNRSHKENQQCLHV